MSDEMNLESNPESIQIERQWISVVSADMLEFAVVDDGNPAVSFNIPMSPDDVGKVAGLVHNPEIDIKVFICVSPKFTLNLNPPE